MKALLKSYFSVLTAAALMSIALSSCQTVTPETRIAENSAMFAQLSPEHKALVQQGRICEGMDSQAVFLAWGMPETQPTVGQQNGKYTERWVYESYEPVTVFNGGPYGYWGPYGYYGGGMGTSTAFIPKQVAWVEFTNGKVTAWSKSGN